jgi:TonB-like protein
MPATRRPSWSRFRIVQVRDARPRIAIATAGLLASVGLHVLLVQAVIWGTTDRLESRRVLEGFGANALGAPDEAVTTVFFLEDSSTNRLNQVAMDEMASAGKLLQSLRLTIVSPNPSLDAALARTREDEQTAPSDAENSADREAKAALFGRYLAQIQARIERAWIRPRSPVGADLFSCHLQVLQGRSGQVQEITLRECAGDTRWQLSLITAVQRASPFPAPPDPGLFAGAVELSFQSEPFAAGRSEEGFEPSMVTAAAENTN